MPVPLFAVAEDRAHVLPAQAPAGQVLQFSFQAARRYDRSVHAVSAETTAVRQRRLV